MVLLRVAQTAVMALTALAVRLPRPALRALASRHGRRRFSRGMATVLVFLALLPSVVPYDHLFAQDTHAAGESDAVHATHCHVSPGTCSDAPVSSGPGQLLLSEPLILAPAMLAILITATATVLVGISFRPEIRPPLGLTP